MFQKEATPGNPLKISARFRGTSLFSKFGCMIRKFSALAFAAFVGFLGTSQVFAADPRVEQGARFEAKGEYEKALGEYRSILADDPRNSEAYYLAAQARMKMKDYSGALANFRLAYRYTPTMSEAYEGAAKVYEALGQKSKAEAERMKDPKNAPAVEESAPVEEAAAAEPVKEPVREEPKAEPEEEPAKPEPVKKAAAPEPVKEVESAPSEMASDDPFEKGVELFKAGKYEEAAPLWREALTKKPGDPGAYFYAGLTRFELGEYDKAEYNLKRGLTYKVRGNEANYYLALVYEKMDRKDSEKRYLQAYLKKASPSSPLRASAEKLLAELNGEKASEATEEKVASAPKEETKKEEVKKEEPAKATKVPEKDVAAASKKVDAVDVDSDKPSLAVANMLLKAHNYEPALKMYKELLDTDLEPEQRYFAMLQMGNIYRELRDYHSAVSRYRVIVQEFPDSDWATEADRAWREANWQRDHENYFPRKKR